MKFNLAPVQKTLLGLFFLIIVGTLGALEFFYSLRTTQLLKDSQIRRGRILTKNMAQSLGDSMLVGEWDRITQRLQELHDADAEITYILLLKPDGQCQVSIGEDKKDKVLAESPRDKAALGALEVLDVPPDKEVSAHEFVSPIILEKDKLGVLRIGYAQGPLHQAVNQVVLLAVAVGIIGTLIGLGLFWWVSRVVICDRISRAVDKLRTGAQEVSQSSNLLTDSSESVSVGAKDQASAVVEASSSVEEVTGMLRKSSEVFQQAQRHSHEATEMAGSGAEAMRKMAQVSQTIRTSGEQMQTAMQEIMGASRAIAKIIKTIDEIAFQTNILALNAAVEAARAGEAGAGFAVVADEVRSLAKRSADAAKETEQLIENSMKKSESGVRINSQVSDHIQSVLGIGETVDSHLQQIVLKVQEVHSLMNALSQETVDQHHGLEHIKVAVGRIHQVTQSNVLSASDNSTCSASLLGRAKELLHSISDLALLVEVVEVSPATLSIAT